MCTERQPVLPFWHAGAKSRKINGLPGAAPGRRFWDGKWSLWTLQTARGHETAGITPPLETCGFSPVRRPPCAFLSSLLRCLNEGLNSRGEVPPVDHKSGTCRPRQGGRFAADVGCDAGGIGGRGDATSGHGGWTILS